MAYDCQRNGHNGKGPASKRLREGVHRWCLRQDDEPFSPMWVEEVLGVDVRSHLLHLLDLY